MAIIIGTNVNDVLDGTNGDDLINGLAGNDSISGNAGNDTIDGGAGNDTLFGGTGLNTLSYASALAGITINLGVATPQDTGGAGIDSIVDFDNLTGSAFADALSGDSDANVIVGGAGNDTLDGGAGVDTVSYAGTASAVSVDLSLITAQNTGGAGVDLLVNFENLTGSAFDDHLTGDLLPNVIVGGAGNDSLDGGDGLDTVSYAGASAAVRLNLSLSTAQNTGGAGIDTIVSFENFVGTDFNDTVTGTVGANVLDGGAGVDTLSYANAAAGVRVSLALATAQGTVGAGTDTLANFENLLGSDFDDALVGHAGANLIVSGAGNDTIDSAAGDDRVIAGIGNDALFGALGNDTLSGGAGDDILYGDATSAAIAGLPGSNQFFPFTEATTALQMANTLLAPGANLSIQSASFSGVFTAGSSFKGISYGPTIALGAGILLTTGDGAPPVVNTSGIYGVDNKEGGDPALDAVALAAFPGAGGTQDAAILEITFTVNDPLMTRVSLDLIFGSEEYPEFVDSSFVDVAAVFVDGVNYALFNGDPLQPLSIVGNNVGNGNFISNTSFPVEYDGLSSTLRVVGDLNPALSVHTLRVGIADTGDAIFDSALFLSNLSLSSAASGIELLANDLIFGGDGNDTLDGGIGNDTLDGGVGVNTVSYATASTAVSVDLGLTSAQNTVGAGLDILLGFANLSGSSFDDTLRGRAGANVIDGGAGDDTLAGAAGNDTYLVDAAGDVVLESAGQGIDTVLAKVSHVLAANVENLTLTGTADSGGTGNALNNVITGNAGNNVMIGGAGNDTLEGRAGNDTLAGGAGADTMLGGAGNDTYLVDAVGESVSELAGQGIDVVRTSLASYALAGNVENLVYTGAGNFSGSGNALANAITGGGGADVLVGGAGNDSVNGAGGNDRLFAGAGADAMAGGLGNDIYSVDDAGDVVSEAAGEGIDTVWTTLAGYTLAAEVETLAFTGVGNFAGTGNGLANTLAGGVGDDTLGGGGGNDILSGRAGADALVGGTGNDVLNGGAGNDVFVFAAAGFGSDRIQDFDADPLDGQDLLDISGLGVTADTYAALVSITDLGADTLLTIGADSVRLLGVADSTSISQADFLLA